MLRETTHPRALNTRFHASAALTSLKTVVVIALAAPILLAGQASADTPGKLSLSSPAFAPNERIPAKYTCSGADVSPELRWSGAPVSTKSFALIVEDPDAPRGLFIHWVLYGIPPSTSKLPEGVEKSERVPGVGLQGRNNFHRIGYGGPCPPPGKPHHYHFRLFALDVVPTLKPGASAQELRKAIQGHVVARGELVGIFSR